MANSNFVERASCPACTSTKYTEIYCAPYDEDPIKQYLKKFYGEGTDLSVISGGKYVLIECSDCHCIYHKFVANDALLSIVYSKWLGTDQHRQMHKACSLEMSSYLASEIMSIIGLVGKEPHEIDVLDFGMGWGRWMLMARAFGLRVRGSDLSSEALVEARENGLNTVTLESLQDESFDFINTDQVIEHIVSPLEILKTLHGALRPGGYVKIAVPTGGSTKSLIRNIDWTRPDTVNLFCPLEHINLFRRQSIEKMAQKIGFQIVKPSLIDQYIYATNWRQVRRIAKNMILPIYRHFGLQNYFMLQKAPLR